MMRHQMAYQVPLRAPPETTAMLLEDVLAVGNRAATQLGPGALRKRAADRDKPRAH